MTHDEIIDMAKQAEIEEAYSLKHNQYLVRFKDGSLEVFAKLVAEKALAEHAMRETQRLGQEIEPKIGCVNHDCDQCKAQTQEPVFTYEQVKAHIQVAMMSTTTTPQRTEQNFCSRCGKRTPDLITIHTCTPPKENT